MTDPVEQWMNDLVVEDAVRRENLRRDKAEAALAAYLNPDHPTQVEHKWRTTTRTVFQALLGLCVILPVLLPALGVSTTVGVGAAVLAVAATVTRVMAVPAVNQWIDRFLPWLRTG